MRRDLLWVATAVALAAGLLMYPHEARAQQPADASAGASQDVQATGSATSEAEGQTGVESSAQAETSNSAAADQETADQTGTATDAAGAAAGADQSAPGPALPPPDPAAQQQEGSAQVQNQGARSQVPQPQAPQDQSRSLSRDQQAIHDGQLDREGLRSRINGEVDSSAQGQADLRAGTRDQDLRHRDSPGVDIGIRFGAATGRGLVIGTIEPNSVLFDSGLREGDVLVSMHGRPIRSEAEFVRWIEMHPGERIPLVILRDGREQTIFITYDQHAVPVDHPHQAAQAPMTGSQPFLGVMFDVQIPNAAVVLDVTPGSPAEHAGLRPGDMIMSLNGQEVSSYHDVISLVRMMRPGDQLVINFSRQVTDQTQALLTGRPAEPVRTATAPDLRYGREARPMPQPMYQDRSLGVPPYGYDRDPRMIDGNRDMRQPLRDRGILPRLRD